MKLLSSLTLAATIVVGIAGVADSTSAPIVGTAGQTSVINGWSIQASAKVSGDLATVSQPGFDVSSWYRMGSHGTVMAGLLEAAVYDDKTLFFSNNLETMVNQSLFTGPWLYREELTFAPQAGQRYFLETNGITSKADLYLNGKEVASKDTLVGAYGGVKFDITQYLNSGKNAVLIQAYPTNYLADFALGFVDWNPYPPDNGTGVWREVTISQTGSVSLLKPRVATDYKGKTIDTVTATVNVVASNSGPDAVQGTLKGVIKELGGTFEVPISASYSLEANENKTITLTASIKDPKIWWPRLWGEQPLYTLDISAYVGSGLSDCAEQRTFGIRYVTSTVSSKKDLSFTVNGNPFLVRGAGYSSDMFLRLNETTLTQQFEYMIDMGMNAVRLEGKQEHPALYDIADRLGLMVLAGWECCDKWEGWTYNDDADGVKWDDTDYTTASKQINHEAYMLQGHASMLAFLVGSDYWPDDRASKIYVDTLNGLNWDVPIVASAGLLGHPNNLPWSGMKMDGPYDWVSPNYWYGDQLGAAFGFGSELGAGVGTPELSSLKKFLTDSDLNDLWTAPNKGLYHMSTNVSQFFDRSIYNQALYARYGKPTSLEDYLLKAQASDYEATRAEYEAYSARQSAARPATGVIYWMLNNAWPSLHWNLFDYYLKGAGSYYGAKLGSRPEHVAFEYGSKNGSVWLINHTIDKKGARSVDLDLLSKDGARMLSRSVKATTKPTTSQLIASIPEATKLKEVAFLRLVLRDETNAVLSRNVYWISPIVDVNDWANSTWYNTPVTTFADYTPLQSLKPAKLSASAATPTVADGSISVDVVLENTASVPAYFIRLELQDANGGDITPAMWTDNYVTLWPGEKLTVGVNWKSVEAHGAGNIQISGGNVGTVGSLALKW